MGETPPEGKTKTKIEKHPQILEVDVQHRRDPIFSLGGRFLCGYLPLYTSLCSSVKWAEFSKEVLGAGSFQWKHFLSLSRIH